MVEVNNLTKIAIDSELVKRVAGKVLNGERKKLLNLSIVFVGEKRIKELNKRYRKKNRLTDVLSFNLASKNSQVSGEVIICPRVVTRNAKKYGSSFRDELVLVLIHGVLHILGYDHEKGKKGARGMEKKQDYYFSQI